MSPELAKWLIGSVVGAVVYISAIVFAVGRKYGKVESTLEALQEAAKKVEKASDKLERIPILEVKVDTIANAQARMSSLLPPMQEKVTALWEKVFSLQNWRRSRPDFGNGNGNGNGE